MDGRRGAGGGGRTNERAGGRTDRKIMLLSHNRTMRGSHIASLV